MARRTAQRGLHPHTREPITIRNPDIPPSAWTSWLALFGASPPLAKRAWKIFRETASAGDLGPIVRLQRRQDRASVQEFLGIMTPGKVFAVLGRLSPEGTARDREVLDVEAAILTRALGPHTWR